MNSLACGSLLWSIIPDATTYVSLIVFSLEIAHLHHQWQNSVRIHINSMVLQELQALIKYIQQNKATDSDWFTITSNKEGTKWNGRCWYIHSLLKYEFPFEFEIPATYPATAPEIKIPELDGKTAKMYRGGSICLTVHFKPLWAKNRSVNCLCILSLSVSWKQKQSVAFADLV